MMGVPKNCQCCGNPIEHGRRIFPKPETDDEIMFQAIMADMFDTFRAKNHDYGGSWRKRGIVAIADKLLTKADRLVTISEDGHVMQVNEGHEDTFLDMANYSVFGVILEREKKVNGK